MSKDITTKDMAALCGINTIQGMIQYAKKYIDRINADGEHFRKVGKEWQYDDVAVERILEIRNKGTITTEMVQESERVREIMEERNKLLEKLNVAQAAILSHKDRIINVQKQFMEQVKQLEQGKSIAEAEVSQAKVDVAEAKAKQTIAENKLTIVEQSYQQKVSSLEELNKSMQATIQELRTQSEYLSKQLTELKAERDNLDSELIKERNKTLFQRLFGK